MPSPCSLPVLAVASWRAAVTRFKPRAARGPDGFAKADLQMMSDQRVEQRLDLLKAVRLLRMVLVPGRLNLLSVWFAV